MLSSSRWSTYKADLEWFCLGELSCPPCLPVCTQQYWAYILGNNPLLLCLIAQLVPALTIENLYIEAYVPLTPYDCFCFVLLEQVLTFWHTRYAPGSLGMFHAPALKSVIYPQSPAAVGNPGLGLLHIRFCFCSSLQSFPYLNRKINYITLNTQPNFSLDLPLDHLKCHSGLCSVSMDQVLWQASYMHHLIYSSQWCRNYYPKLVWKKIKTDRQAQRRSYTTPAASVWRIPKSTLLQSHLSSYTNLLNTKAT